MLKSTGTFPSATCLKNSKREELGYSEGTLGKLFFPLSHDVETFQSFGWPGKPEESQAADDEKNNVRID